MLSGRAALIAALLALGAPAVPAALVPWGPTVPVFADPIDSSAVATAIGEDGSFLIVWGRFDHPNYPSRWHLFVQTFDRTGEPRAAARDLLTGFGSAQAAALPGGGYLLAWERGGPSPFRGQLLDALGTPLGEPFDLSDSGGDPIYEYYLRLAVTDDGFAALWAHSVFHTRPDGTTSIDKQFRLRLFDRDGTPRGPSVEVNPLAHVSNADGGFADLAAVEGGGFCTVWSWELQPGATASIRARRFDAAGAAATGELQISSAGVQGYAYSNFPRAAAHPDRSCTLAWVSLDDPATRAKHIHLVRLGPGGEVGPERLAPVGAPLSDTDYGFGFQMASDRRGGVLMLDATGYGHPFSPFPPASLRRLDAEGYEVDAAIEAVPGGFFTALALAVNESGEGVVAWGGNGRGTYPDHHDVLARQFRLTCSPDERRLCLGDDARFALEATWRTPDGRGGTATPIPVTSDTGGFWFFSPVNLELLVKVLDGRAVNGRFWVLWGGLTNLDVRLDVTDTLTRATRTYANPAGHYPSAADVRAFADDAPGAAAARAAPAVPKPFTAPPSAPAASGTCSPGPTSLCLGGRYRVELAWRDRDGNRGDGHPLAASEDAAFLWFFTPANLELAVKVLDGTPVNGHRWVFVAGLTDVEYTLTVTDTATGAERTYANPPGSMRSFADTAAF